LCQKKENQKGNRKETYSGQRKQRRKSQANPNFNFPQKKPTISGAKLKTT